MLTEASVVLDKKEHTNFEGEDEPIFWHEDLEVMKHILEI